MEEDSLIGLWTMTAPQAFAVSGHVCVSVAVQRSLPFEWQKLHFSPSPESKRKERKYHRKLHEHHHKRLHQVAQSKEESTRR